jgi:hypothetical protein
LKSGRHEQAEGIAIGVGVVADFDVVISDEGDDGRARLARYRARTRDVREVEKPIVRAGETRSESQ